MKYLCVGYYDQDRMDALTQAQVDVVMSECPVLMEEFYDSGKVSLVAGTDSEARALQRVGGEVRETVGAKGGRHGTVGCVFLVEALDMEDAIRVAKRHPTTRIEAGEQLGWRIGISPVHYFREGKPIEKGREEPLHA
jgi:hypothetical protein